jgi:hypothetical protein
VAVERSRRSRRSRVPAAALDVALLAGPPAALVAVFALPAGVRRGLALSLLDPAPVTLYTAHLVHFRLSHLAANVVGYAVAGTTGYLLAAAAGTRARYRGALAVVLVVLPVALSGLNLLFPRPRIGYGASGVVMGAVGLVPVFLFAYLDGVPGIDAGVADAPALFFAGLAVAAVAAPLGALGRWIGVAAVLAAVLYGLEVGLDRDALGALPSGHPELLAASVVVAVGYPAVAFPADPAVEGGIVDLYTHLLGYALAFVPAYLAPGIGLGALDRADQSSSDR